MSCITACTTAAVTAPNTLTGEGALELTLTNFRNNNGMAIIFIYSGPKGFPDADAPNLIRLNQPIRDQQVHFTLDNQPYNSYAIAVLHDENLNGQMDKSLLGFPSEGVGFSRNPEFLFGPPDYEKARFLLAARHQQQTIELQYPKKRKLRPENAGSSAGRLK